MGYTDSLLASGETIVRREHQHWFWLAWNARWGLLSVIGAIVLVVIRMAVTSTNDTLMSGIGYLALILLVIGLLILVWSWLEYRAEEYVITTLRIIHAEGVLNKTATDSSLDKINDAQLKESMFGRLFGFGDLEVMTASESGIERLRMLRDAKGFKIAMVEAKEALESSRSRMTMPPLRANDAPPAAPPTA